jgi:hypothetical protein
MKKYLIISALLFQFAFSSEKDSLSTPNPFLKFKQFANDLYDDCNACGSSASGVSLGFASILNTNFVGLRYFYQSYKSIDGLYSNSPWFTENFNTIQLWARIPVVKKVQISVLIPFHFHNRETFSGKQNSSGIGDATIIGMYQLFQTSKDRALVKHTFQLGGGVKIPLGKFNEQNNGSFNPSYQVGTGSWDYLLATEYVVKRKQFGLNAMLNYVLKTENDKNYRFGNQMNYAATLFYIFKKNNYAIAPQLGFAGEVYEDNFQHNQKVRNTAGAIFMGKLGFEISKERLSIGTNFMLPISQNLTGGNVEANYRLSLNFNYSL